MAKAIIHGDQSRQAILRGVNQLADAVKITLSSKGRNVLLDRKFGSPLMTKDGSTAAKEIELKEGSRTTPRLSKGRQVGRHGGRVKQLRVQIDETPSGYDSEKLQERLAKLVGSVAVIKAGAATETELKEKKARVEDVMHATRAAVEEGIVPGSGVALVRCICARET